MEAELCFPSLFLRFLYLEAQTGSSMTVLSWLLVQSFTEKIN